MIIKSSLRNGYTCDLKLVDGYEFKLTWYDKDNNVCSYREALKSFIEFNNYENNCINNFNQLDDIYHIF